MESRQNGTCKWFNATKGFGFITDSSGGGDLFVHHTCINGEGFKTLLEGEAVEFDVQIDERGRKKAVNVSGPNGSRVIGDQRGQGMPPRGGHGDDRGYAQGGSYSGRSGGGRHYQGGASGGRDYNGGSYGAQRDYQGGGAMGGYSSRYGNSGGDYQSSRGAY